MLTFDCKSRLKIFPIEAIGKYHILISTYQTV